MLKFLKFLGCGRKYQAGGIRLNDAVYLLHDPGPQPEVELIFIHGLQTTESDKHAYWTAWLARDGAELDTCWPATLLQRAQGFAVAARVLSLKIESTSATALETSDLLQQMSLQWYLHDANIGQNNNCPVVFVFNSLGGMVADRVVLSALKFHLACNKKAQNLLRNLKGFFFYSTPHSGAKPYGELCKGLASLQCFTELEIQMHQLYVEFQRLIREEFKDKWKFRVAAESCATVINGRKIEAVKHASGKHIGVDHVVTIPTADHITVCQPESKNCISFQSLKAFVQGILKDFQSEGSETNLFTSPAREDPRPSYRVSSRDLKSGCLLGKGFSGIVYETKWNGKRRARKDFLRVPSDIFEREANVLVRLQVHPNVVQTFGWTVNNGSCSLVLELMDGNLWNLARKRMDLQRKIQSTSDRGSSPKSQVIPPHQFIEERKNASPVSYTRESRTVYPFHIREVVQIITGIASGMKFLHDNKVAHGDLKPRNILVTLRRPGSSNSLHQKLDIDQVKLVDFGVIETKSKSKSMTSASSEARKLDLIRWKAPELVDGLSGNLRHDFDDLAKGDVYSFAVTCFQILTGEEPLPDYKQVATSSILNGLRPELPSTCPQQLRELITQCQNCEKTKRPTFDRILNDLEKIQQGLFVEGSNVKVLQSQIVTRSYNNVGIVTHTHYMCKVPKEALILEQTNSLSKMNDTKYSLHHFEGL